MTLSVTATDTEHQIFAVHETIPVQHAGDVVLLYSQWETGSHAPTASAIELAGLVVHVDGHRTAWCRDPTNSHAFRVHVPNGARTIALDFQFLAPHRAALLRANMIDVPWQRLLLYPSGWYVRNIPVDASVTLPPGMRAFTALTTERHDGSMFAFSRTMWTSWSTRRFMGGATGVSSRFRRVPLRRSGSMLRRPRSPPTHEPARHGHRPRREACVPVSDH